VIFKQIVRATLDTPETTVVLAMRVWLANTRLPWVMQCAPTVLQGNIPWRLAPQNPRKRNKVDPVAPQIPGSPPCTGKKKCQKKQRDPGIEPLEGMTTSKLADKYIVKRNKIRNQCTLLRDQVEDGVIAYLDKVEETIRACDNLLLTWKTHGSPLGDRKVKEIMYKMISQTIDELDVMDVY